MASSQAVYIKSGDQPRAFTFGNSSAQVNSTTTVQASLPIYKESVYSTFQATVVGSGALTATVTIQASNDDNTGRGFIFDGKNGPGALASTVSGNATLTAQGVSFPASIVGFTIVGPGIPAGTTVSAVTSAGSALVMSAAATATATIQVNFLANNWLATVLGTISLTGSGNGAGTLSGVSDGFTTVSPWRYVRASVTAITGTSATVFVTMGV